MKLKDLPVNQPFRFKGNYFGNEICIAIRRTKVMYEKSKTGFLIPSKGKVYYWGDPETEVIIIEENAG